MAPLGRDNRFRFRAKNEQELRAILQALDQLGGETDDEIAALDVRVTALEASSSSLEHPEPPFLQNTSAGQPVFIDNSGNAVLGKADDISTAEVIGLAIADVTATNTAGVQCIGYLELADWSAVVGSASLTPGAIYYLSEATAGIMTTTAPTGSPNVNKALGTAVTTKIFHIDIEDSYQLVD